MKTEALTSIVAESNFTSQKVKGLSLNSSFAFNILVKAIYSDPFQTSIQEYISNARDAHRRVGKDESTIEINYPTAASPMFSVRDYGCSISPDKMDDLVLVVGDSDKRATNQETGGYGLGFKSGFAITSSFIVDVYYKNMHRLYNLRYDEEGNAICEMLTESPTTEDDGVRVTIPLESSDIEKVRRAITRAVCCWKIKPKTNLQDYQLAQAFPDMSKNIVHEDDKVVIYERNQISYYSSLYQYNEGESATQNLIFPVLFDSIPNDCPYTANQEISGVVKGNYPFTKSFKHHVFFKAGVDDIKQGPSRESFVVTESLPVWYKDRLDHVEKLCKDLIEKMIDLTDFKTLGQSINDAMEMFRPTTPNNVMEHLNLNWIPAVKPQVKGYSLDFISTIDNEKVYTLSHGLLSDNIFPYQYYSKGQRHRRRSAEWFSYSNILALEKATPLFGYGSRFIKPFIYQNSKGEWTEFPYFLNTNVDQSIKPIAKVRCVDNGSGNVKIHILPTIAFEGETARTEFFSLQKESYPDPQLFEAVDEISRLAAPYHPKITFVPIEPRPEAGPVEERIYTPITHYDKWWSGAVLEESRINTMCFHSQLRIFISNRVLEQNDKKNYKRRVKQCIPSYILNYMLVDENDISPEMLKELVEVFGAIEISKAQLPAAPIKEKSTQKSMILYFGSTNTYSEIERKTRTIVYDDMDSFLENLESVANFQNTLEKTKVYFLPKSIFEAMHTGSLIGSYKVPFKYYQAFMYFREQLAEGELCRIYFVADKSLSLIKKAKEHLENIPKESQDEVDLELGLFQDVIPGGLEAFASEKGMVKLLDWMGSQIQAPAKGNVTLRDYQMQLALEPGYMKEMNIARKYFQEKTGWTHAQLEQLFNIPEYAPLSVLMGHSTFLLPPKFILENKNQGVVVTNVYLTEYFAIKGSANKTYDWKIMEGFIDLLKTVPTSLSYIIRYGTIQMPGLKAKEYKEIVGSGISLADVKKVIKSAKKLPIFAAETSLDYGAHKDSPELLAQGVHKGVKRFLNRLAIGGTIVKKENTPSVKNWEYQFLLFKKPEEQLAALKLTLEGLAHVFHLDKGDEIMKAVLADREEKLKQLAAQTEEPEKVNKELLDQDPEDDEIDVEFEHIDDDYEDEIEDEEPVFEYEEVNAFDE